MYANFTGRFQYSTAIGVNVRVMRKFLVPTANDYVDACAVFNCTAIYDRISPYIIHTWRMTYVSWNFLFYDNTIVEKFFFFISIRVKGQWSSHAFFPIEKDEKEKVFFRFSSRFRRISHRIWKSIFLVRDSRFLNRAWTFAFILSFLFLVSLIVEKFNALNERLRFLGWMR